MRKRVLIGATGVLAFSGIPILGQRQFTVSPASKPIGTHAFTVLRTTGVDAAGGSVTLTLLSGAKISVPIADVDTEFSGAINSGYTAYVKAVAESTVDILPTPDAAMPTIRSKCATAGNAAAQTRCQDQQRTAVYAMWARPMTTPEARAVRNECRQKSPDDFVQRSACEEPRVWTPQRTAAPAPATPAVPYVDVPAKCAKEWATDFTMQKYCADQQHKAFATLRARSMTTTDQQTIRRKCSAEWDDDYTMMNYCEEQQLKALAAIR